MILDILDKINIPSHDNGIRFTKTDRIDFIKSELLKSQYRLTDLGIALIYSKKPIETLKDASVMLISSHVDCVKEMTACFSKKIDNHFIKGTYDNSITNAAVLSLMLKNRLPDNVVIAFTGNEEYGGAGAIRVAEYFDSFDIVPITIVLDVTYDGYRENKFFTIENLNEYLENSNFIPHTALILKKEREHYVYVDDADIDETWKYSKYEFPCFSLCLPVKGKMHSTEGVTVRLDSFKEYIRALEKISNTSFITFE